MARLAERESEKENSLMNELIFGNSESFQKVMAKVELYAPHAWPALILGETGVGKELIARKLHDLSQRKAMPFIPVNCSAIPAGLFESELFGYERGAFSGAMNPSKGLAKMAHGGTLFLDELGELDINLQAKLLRLIDSGEVRSVGSQKVEHVNVRVIAATNVDLSAAVAAGLFRQDLLERLSVLRIHVPPLRDRKEDILLIATEILERLGSRFSVEDLKLLTLFDWPGNVRQLRNLLIRASVLGKMKVGEPLLKQLLKEEARESTVGAAPKEREALLQGPLEAIERDVIIDRLKKFHGNRKEAAKDLGIAKSTLHEKLRRWKEDPSVEKLGLWLAGLTLLVSPSFANTDRISWIVEQIVLPPLPPVAEKAGFQAMAQGVNYSDAFSLLGDVLYDSRLVDVGVKYSERLFPAWTEEGQSLKRESLGLRKSFAAQVGRSFLTQENHYGRLSAEFIQFDPSTFRLLRRL
ncbi:sigma-54-dependent Fis family transcriptional regulator [bacterium]|nr:sigma-54-dependent Fis family transcriptional regulator [bacterium]